VLEIDNFLIGLERLKPLLIVMDIKEEIKLPERENVKIETAPHFNDKKLYTAVKRAFDVIMSSIALVICVIPMIFVAILVWSTSKGPILFRQPRVGRNGKLFNCLKFRTMYITAPKAVATSELKNASSQITKVGKFLRKTSLDELPQFINIFRGDMSFVGPRPLIPAEKEIHTLRYSYGVYNIRPGITGWAQVNGRDRVSARDKAKLDKYYYDNRSVLLDLKILFITVPRVLFGADIVEGKRAKEEKKKTENKAK